MTDNMTSVEQAGKSQSQKVAERWLKIRGVGKPQEGQPVSENATNSSVPLIQEAYDLFAEKQDLNQEIVRHQLSLTKPISKDTPEKEKWSKAQEEYKKAGEELKKLLEAASDNLSFEEKRDLIRQGKIAKLTGIEQNNALIPPQKIAVIKQSQARIGEVDARLEKIFAVPGTYNKFVADLTHQIGVRHQAHEVNSLVRFGQEADLLALKISREAQVDGRPLTSIEKRTIEESRTLKEEAGKRIAELSSNPDVFDKLRMVELKRYRSQLDKDHFAETPSRTDYLEKIEGYWSEGKKVLLSGETGTGKTEMIKHASNKLFGINPESVTGHQDMSIYELLGKTGFQVQVGDVFRPAPLIRAMTGRDGKGQPFLFDEIDRAPNQAVMGIKTILNARPGEKGIKVQTDTAGSFNVGQDYAVSATANIKSEKYQTATELDPAIVRVFDAPLEIDYMPPHEVYDLALSSIFDKRGCIPLSEQDARTTLKNLCDAASWIQDAYQGRKIVTDTSKNTFLEARGQGSTGRVASLKKALLDPGRTIDMLKGWSGAQVRGESFEDYLNSRIIEFINNRAYPEDDRYYLTEIFALKGFLKGVQSDKLSVPSLTQAVLDRWSGGSNKNKQQLAQSEYLTADRVVRLDPYKRFVRPIDAEAEEMLKETEVTKEAKTTSSEASDFAEAKDIMGTDFFGPDEVENAFGFEIDKDLIPDIPFSAQELADAKANGQYLMLYVSNKADGTRITAQELVNTLQEKFNSDGKGKIQYDTDWYENEKFYTTDTPRIAWRLITKDVIPGSLNHNYLKQTEDIAKYLKGTVFKGRSIPADYQKAIDEFERQKKGIGKNLSSDWQDSANKLLKLKLTQLTRQTFVEERYGWLVYFQNRNDRLLESKYTWTGAQASDGGLVGVGALMLRVRVWTTGNRATRMALLALCFPGSFSWFLYPWSFSPCFP